MEGLALYTPLSVTAKFHQSLAAERLVVGSNQSGKTLSAAADLAWAATGTHPWVPCKKENALIYCIGYDFSHIQEVMWKKLASPGAFSIIPDEITEKWRPVLPDNEYDKAYPEKWREAAPLLPERFIKEIAWYQKGKGIPEIVTLVNGTKIIWFSSKGAPQKGSQIDWWWMDEEIENQRWLPEVEARCIRRGGRGVWSCTPEHSTEQLYQMHLRCNSPYEKWDVAEFFLTLVDNAYISKEQKERFYKQLRSDAERRTKYYGEFMLAGMSVYSEYSQTRHVVDSFIPPEDWSRHMLVDPGRNVCAVLFCAVPPPGSEHDGEYHVYDECYIRMCTASKFANEVAQKMGHRKDGGFESFVIDWQSARVSELATGSTIVSAYSDALAEQGIWSQLTGSDFLHGSNDMKGREEALHRWLEDNPFTGKPTVRIHRKCRYLDWELQNQFYKKDKNGPTDKRVDKDDHAVWCLEAFADYEPAWTSPPKYKRGNPILKLIKKDKRNGKAIVLGPA